MRWTGQGLLVGRRHHRARRDGRDGQGPARYSPPLKGTVESLNRAADRMLFAALPGYTAGPTRPRSGRRGRTNRTTEAVSVLSFQDFPQRSWKGRTGGTPHTARKPCPAVHRWRRGRPIRPLSPTSRRRPVGLHPRGRGRLRKLTSHGVSWRGHTYIAAWMTGQTGRQVRVRYMPHHDHEIEICDARGRHLGPATSPTRPALSNCRRCAKPVRSALGASAPTRRPPIACAASDSPPPPARSPPSGWEPYSRQADRELAAAADHTDVARLALPDLIPPAHRPHTGAPRPL